MSTGGEVRVVSDQVENVKRELSQKANDILAQVDALKTTYDREVIEERGLVGNRANQLTDWFTQWHSTFRTKTENDLTEFRTQVNNAANDILAAGGNA